jgi:exopolyphosphatase/guanosine-5'-triphosphate,3'-diphosphate pyrophosphatase
MEEATANNSLTVAAVDLGSNTFRLLIAGIVAGRLAVLVKKNITVGLGQGLTAAGGLATARIDAGLAALRTFRGVMAGYHLDCCRCCGTEALRQAGNVQVFLGPAQLLLGTEVAVLSGAEEAELTWRGVLAALPAAVPYPLLIVDVGGGSTELIFVRELAARPLTGSFPAGAALFTGLAGSAGLAVARARWRTGLRDFLAKCCPLGPKTSVVATGGTATALAALALRLNRYDGKKVHGYRLPTGKIMELATDLAGLSAAAKVMLPGLEPGRGNILLAGLEIYQEILATIGVDGMIISDSGLLEGIMLSCLTPGPGRFNLIL